MLRRTKNIKVTDGFPVFRLAHVNKTGDKVVISYFIFIRLAYFRIPKETVGMKRKVPGREYYEINEYDVQTTYNKLMSNIYSNDKMLEIVDNAKLVKTWYYAVT